MSPWRYFNTSFMANTSGYGLLFPGPIYCLLSDCLSVGEMDIFFYCHHSGSYRGYWMLRPLGLGNVLRIRVYRSWNYRKFTKFMGIKSPPNMPLFLFCNLMEGVKWSSFWLKKLSYCPETWIKKTLGINGA